MDKFQKKGNVTKTKNKFLVDESLVARVQFKADGSNIHRLKNIISTYVGGVETQNTYGPCPEIAALQNGAERKLRQFVVTGHLSKEKFAHEQQNASVD